jgi:hypothetical protein
MDFGAEMQSVAVLPSPLTRTDACIVISAKNWV